jgi:hypothetical protein
VETAAATTVLRDGFEYVRAVRTFPTSAPPYQVVYDSQRQRVYATLPDANAIQVISTRDWTVSAIAAGPAPAGIALTPDGSRLAVANFGNGTVTLLDPDRPADRTDFPVLDPGDTDADPRPLEVAVAADGSVFVAMNRPAVTGCFNPLLGYHQVRLLEPRTGIVTDPDVDTTCLGDTVHLGASADGRTIAVSNIGFTDGGVFLWDPVRRAFVPRGGDAFLGGLSFARGVLSLGPRLYDADVRPRAIPGGPLAEHLGVGSSLHPEASVLFVPCVGGIAVVDSWSGTVRRVFSLGLEPAFVPGGIASDDWGARVFVATTTGVAVVELATPPLGIGNVEPDVVPAGGGQVTVRGSGFAAGTTVLVGGIAAEAQVVDPNTLSVRVPTGKVGPAAVEVRTPDGRRYHLDAAVVRTP